MPPGLHTAMVKLPLMVKLMPTPKLMLKLTKVPKVLKQAPMPKLMLNLTLMVLRKKLKKRSTHAMIHLTPPGLHTAMVKLPLMVKLMQTPKLVNEIALNEVVETAGNSVTSHRLHH